MFPIWTLVEDLLRWQISVVYQSPLRRILGKDLRIRWLASTACDRSHVTATTSHIPEVKQSGIIQHAIDCHKSLGALHTGARSSHGSLCRSLLSTDWWIVLSSLELKQWAMGGKRKVTWCLYDTVTRMLWAH